MARRVTPTASAVKEQPPATKEEEPKRIARRVTPQPPAAATPDASLAQDSAAAKDSAPMVRRRDQGQSAEPVAGPANKMVRQRNPNAPRAEEVAGPPNKMVRQRNPSNQAAQAEASSLAETKTPMVRRITRDAAAPSTAPASKPDEAKRMVRQQNWASESSLSTDSKSLLDTDTDA